MNFFGKMPLSAPLHVRCPNKLFILNLIYFRIGQNESWQINLKRLVDLANEYTPHNQKRWTYGRVKYAVAQLKKLGWLRSERPNRYRGLLYFRSTPTDLLPLEPKPVNIIKVEHRKYTVEEFDAAINSITIESDSFV